VKRFKNKKMLTIGLVTALVLGLGGAAFAYFTTTGTRYGSAHVGTPSNLVITRSARLPTTARSRWPTIRIPRHSRNPDQPFR